MCNAMTFRYEDLRVGKDILTFIEEVYVVTSSYPAHEKFALQSQTNRAAVSVYLNLAEGSARNSKADFSRFITIALGSLVEVHAALGVTHKLGYIEKTCRESLELKILSIWKQLHALRQSQQT